MNSNVKTAVRVLELLEFLSRAQAPLALSDVVAGLGFSRSCAAALLDALVERGYLRRAGDARYVLNARFPAGRAACGAKSSLVAVARPVMESLRADLSESVFLGVPAANGSVKVLAKEVSESEVRYDLNLSEVHPAHCTAMGRVMLAFWDAAAREAYLARTPLRPATAHTITDPARLRAVLRQARRDGYAIVDQEFTVGGSAAAAPIFGRDGRVAAVLNVGAVSPRFFAAHQRIVAGVVRAATTISRRLGQPRTARLSPRAPQVEALHA